MKDLGHAQDSSSYQLHGGVVRCRAQPIWVRNCDQGGLCIANKPRGKYCVFSIGK